MVDGSTYLPTSGRDPAAEYAAAHIPGAIFFDLDASSDAASPLPHMLPSADAFARRMSALGLDDADDIVVYDGSGVNLSARARLVDLPGVRPRSGRGARWRVRRSGGARAVRSSPGTAARRPARFSARPTARAVRDRAAVLANLDSVGGEQVVDMRSAGRFAGTEPEPRAGLRGGHIPGSRNLPFDELVAPDGTLRPANALRRRLAAAGVDPARPIVATCGSGTSACALIHALHVLGHDTATLYDGSWTEWGGRPRHAGGDGTGVTAPGTRATAATAATAPAGTAVAFGCLVLFLLPFAGFGVYAAVMAARAARLGDWAQAGYASIFMLVFGGVGLGGIAAVFAGRRRALEGQAREARQPDAPWLWREDWAARRITDGSRTQVWLAWGMAAFWNLVSLPGAIVAVRAALHGGNRAALVALLFPAIGLGLLVWAAGRRSDTSATACRGSSWPRCRPPWATRSRAPCGRPAGLRPPEGFKVVLTCIRRVTTGTGRNRSTTEYVLWQDERRCRATGDRRAGRVRDPARRRAVRRDPRRPTGRSGASPSRRRAGRGLRGDVRGAGVPHRRERPAAHRRGAGGGRAVRRSGRLPPARGLQDRGEHHAAGHRDPRSRAPGIPAWRRGSRRSSRSGGATWATIALHAPLCSRSCSAASACCSSSRTRPVAPRHAGHRRRRRGDRRERLAGRGDGRTLRPDEIADVTTEDRHAVGRHAVLRCDHRDDGRETGAGGAIRDKREAEWLAATFKRAVQPEPGEL